MKPVKRNVLLNPGPATTTDTVKRALVVPDICPREPGFGAVLRAVRQGLVRVVTKDEGFTAVPVSGSGTTAVEATVSSAVPENGALFVVANGAYGERICRIAEIHGIETVAFRPGECALPDIAELERALDACGKRLTHLAVVHHETTTGLLNPLENMCRAAKARGLEVIVDAMSSYAGIPIDVSKLDIDYLIASSNKCIQGMAGLGFAICKTESLQKTGNILERTLSLNLYRQYRSLEETGQSLFTPPVQIVYALKQALDEYFAEGGENRYRRYTENWETLVAGLRKLGFRFLLPDEYQSRILLSVIEPRAETYSFEKMHDHLYARGFTIYPGKSPGRQVFRLSVLGALERPDIEAFLKALKEYLTTHKITV